MRKVVRKDAPKKTIDKSTKKHWSDRHKILISVVAWVSLIGSFVFLVVMGDSMR